MYNYKEEKVNMFFLIIMLFMLILLIVYNSYEEEYELFVNAENTALNRYSKIKDVNTYFSEFNLLYSNKNQVAVINETNINKLPNNAFEYTDRVEDKGIYFVGELNAENDFYDLQINYMNHVLKFMEMFNSVSGKYENFKYCVYVSDKNFASLYPYDEDGIDNIYFRYLMDNAYKNKEINSDTYNLSTDKGLAHKIWTGVEYIEEYDKFFEIICIEYIYSTVYGKFDGKVYFAFDFEPEKYLLDNKYDNYFVYTDLEMLYYENGKSKLTDLSEAIEGERFESFKEYLRLMTNTNVKEKIFESPKNYFKIFIIDLSNNIIILRVSKMELLLNAIIASSEYILILFISMLGYMFFLFEIRNIKKLDTLVKKLEITNKRLIIADKIDYATGLLNRRAVPDYANEIQKMFFVIIISVNSVNFINEYYGYEIVDNLILNISKSLALFFDPKHKIIRWGGKDFMILYYGDHDEDVKQKCNQLNKELERLIVTDNLGHKLDFTVSISIAQKGNYNDGFTAISDAEKTMQYLKKADKGNIMTFDEMTKLESSSQSKK